VRAKLTNQRALLMRCLRSRDGEVLFSTEPSAVGERVSLSDEMRRAFEGGTASVLLSQAADRDVAGPPLAAKTVVSETSRSSTRPAGREQS